MEDGPFFFLTLTISACPYDVFHAARRPNVTAVKAPLVLMGLE